MGVPSLAPGWCRLLQSPAAKGLCEILHHLDIVIEVLLLEHLGRSPPTEMLRKLFVFYATGTERRR